MPATPRRAVFLLLPLLSLAACDPTPGRLVPFVMESEVVSELPSTPSSFVTDTGWTVELSTARIAVGPVYLFENASTVVRAPAWRRGLRAIGDLVLPAAHAHPGDEFFAGGQALGEWADQWVLDLVGTTGPLELGPTAGIEGRVRSASLLLQPPTAPNARANPELEGHTVLLAGTATRGAEVVPFRLALDYPEVLAEQRVAGIAADLALTEGVHVRIGLRSAALFAGADFSGLAQEEVPPGHALAWAVQVNLRRAATWTVRAAP
jgi:hypothetical protein